MTRVRYEYRIEERSTWHDEDWVDSDAGRASTLSLARQDLRMMQDAYPETEFRITRRPNVWEVCP